MLDCPLQTEPGELRDGEQVPQSLGTTVEIFTDFAIDFGHGSTRLRKSDRKDGSSLGTEVSNGLV